MIPSRVLAGPGDIANASGQSERIGGGPKQCGSLASSHRATPLRQPRELAEWVEFLEKYAHLDHLEVPFGGGGRGYKMVCIALASFTHTHTQGARNCPLFLVQKPLCLRKCPKWRPAVQAECAVRRPAHSRDISFGGQLFPFGSYLSMVGRENAWKFKFPSGQFFNLWPRGGRAGPVTTHWIPGGQPAWWPVLRSETEAAGQRVRATWLGEEHHRAVDIGSYDALQTVKLVSPSLRHATFIIGTLAAN